MTPWWRRLRYGLALIGLCAIATCPQAKRACVADVRPREAHELLDQLATQVTAVVAATGKVPPVAAGPTPETSCCARGGTCEPDPELWSAPGWRALQFSVDAAFRYRYEYVPDASGLSAVVRATGDPSCDDHAERIELRLDVRGDRVERTWTRTAVAE